jgi:hypothetical protein
MGNGMADISNNSQRQSYPLAALFILIAACGILLALVVQVIRGVSVTRAGPGELVVAGALGTCLGMILGMLVGIHHYQRLRGIAMGGLSGALIGAVAGLVIMIPAENFAGLIAASLGGSLVLLLVGAVLRFLSYHAPASNDSPSKETDQPPIGKNS